MTKPPRPTIVTMLLIAAAANCGTIVCRAADPATATATTAPATAPINHVLAHDGIVPEVRFEFVALVDAIDFLRDVSSANMFIDWRSLADAGTRRDTPLSMRLRKVPLSAVIATMLQSIAPKAALEWTVDDDQVICISSRPGLQRLVRRETDVRQMKLENPALSKKLPEVRFDSVALSDAIDFFRDISGAKIFINWDHLQRGGVDHNTAVSLRLRDVSAARAIDLMLASASTDRAPINAHLDEGIVVIDLAQADQPSTKP